MKKFSRIFLSLVLITGFIANDVGPSITKAQATSTCSINGPTPSESTNPTTGLRVVKFEAASDTSDATCEFVVPAGITSVRVISVSGGGGGGWDGGGGGGGGGVNKYDNYAVTPLARIVVKVGGGGAAATSSTAGGNGGESSFNGERAAGGGAGGNKLTAGIANTTGSAGGAGHTNNNSVTRAGGTATKSPANINFESDGGSSIGDYGGGGGGATAAGSNATITSAGAGGAGFFSSIEGSGATYGGGGGGGTWRAATATSGGSGGGGAGGTQDSNAAQGTDGLGGGGGGGGRADTNRAPGRGGSGVVLVSYRVTDVCTSTESTSGGFTTVVFANTTSQISNCRTTWSVPSGVSSVDVLVLAGGGGGGGMYVAGGGGAGGYKYLTSQNVSGTITVQVGGGGKGGETFSSGVTAIGNSGFDGGNSLFGSIESTGGGGGGSFNVWINGRTGGSGGGGGGAGGNGSSAVSGQGNAGASGAWNASNPGGGGGGYGSAGSVGTSTNGGAGGSGTSNPISGVSVNSVSITTVAAGGGGGSDNAGGAGGSSIGGNGGAINVAGSSATANTGSGGGGAGGGNIANLRYGGNGSAGLVVIKYAKTLNITFNSQGGSAVSSTTVLTTATLSAPTTPTRAGYGLTGWSLTSNGSVVTFPFTHNQSSDFTLFARWSANTLTISYDSQGGSGISPGSTTTGSSIASSPGTPTRSGYTFNGWFVASTGGSQISFPYTHNQTSNFTLFAQWSVSAPTLNSVTVAGTALSGSVITATPSATGLGTITYSYQWMRILTGLGTFQIDGATSSTYTLTDSDLFGYLYVNVIASNEVGSSSTVFGSMPADQKIGVVTPTISGYLQSGHLLTGATSSTIPAGANSEYQWLRADTAAGTYTAISGATSSTYRLTSSDVGKYIKFSIVIRNISRGVTSIASTSNATNVVADIYTISYAAGGGSGSGPSTPTTVINGSTFTLPANTFTRAGYTFAGWSNGTSSYQAGETYPAASGNVSLIATWTSNSLTITYNTQDGSAISSGSTTTGSSIASSPGTPTRSGYTFNGWFVASTGGSQISFPYTHGQTANFTLFAQWTAVAETPTISTQPQSASKYSGQSVTFTASASVSDSGSLSYQWRKNDSNISGATLSTYTISSVTSGDAGDYTVVITNSLNGATSSITTNAATLTFVATTQLSTPTAPTVTATSGSTTSITVAFTTDANATSYTVRVFQGGSLVGSARTGFASGSTITGLTAGTAYTVTVTAIGDGTIYSDSAASSAASVTTNAAAVTPTISTQPISATKYAGQSIDFTVVATAADSGSLSYQWKKNGTDISGATSATYTIASVASGDSASYTVVVTNTKNGTTATSTSNAASLIFGTATQLSTPTAPTVSATAGSTTSITISFSSVANTSSYTVRVFDAGVLVGTERTNFTSGSAVTELGASTTYTVTVTAIGDGTIYSDSAASSASSVTTNAVAVAPTITSQPIPASKFTGQSVTFSVTATASDSGTLSYQWKRGGISISGATSATYSISTLITESAGDYTVVVTNTKNGTSTDTTSNAATLTVTVQRFTVTYSAPDKDSGSVPVDSVGPYVANATVTLLGNTGGLTRGSYSFAGWRTSSDATVRGANSTFSITADTTFIAVWTEIFQLSFNANGGSGTMNDLDGPTVTIPNSTFTRSGYTFSGWNTAANGSGFSIPISQSFPLTIDVIIYAQWTLDSVTPTNTITFASISNKSYGDTFSVTVSASSGLTVTVSSSTTSVCTISTLSVTAVSVGTCTLVAAQAGNGTYPAATSVTRSFTVGKKSLVITASDQSGTVGDSTIAPSYSQSGLVSGDVIGSVSYTYTGSGSTRYTQSSSAPAQGGKWILGTYKITPASVVLSTGSASNYNISYVQGTLSVSGTSTTGISGISVKSTGLNRTTELLTNFSAATTSYGIYVESAVSSVTVVITRNAGSLANAQVSVNDSGFRRLTFTSNAANSGILALPQQSNTITLKIVATDLSVQTYTISILRDQATSSATGGVATPTPTASPRAATQVINSVAFYVNSTSGNTSSLIEVSMNRAFDKAVNSYTVSFTNAQSVTQLRTTFTDPGITVRIKVNQGAFRTIPSTGASTSLALNEGANTAILRVLSSDGTVADYTFTLNRAS
jgi:uncharacterized repeat protein (TIGR02543 family)